MSRHILALALLLGHAAAGTAQAGPCSPVLPTQVRVMNCRLAALIEDGMQRSPTFRKLVDGIAALNGIVYVVLEPTAPTNKTLLGALSHAVAGSAGVRVLRITVRNDRGDATIATIAHELRHATELLEAPDVNTDAAVTALFARIGVELRPGVFETSAAIASERAVSRELRHSHHDRPLLRAGPTSSSLLRSLARRRMAVNARCSSGRSAAIQGGGS